MPSTRAPARRSRSKRGRARRAGRRRGPAEWLGLSLPRLPVLDQRQRDVLGLALVALGVFMGFVLYSAGGSATLGGGLGHGLAVALGWMLGRARVLAPVALAAAGGALLVRPVLPAVRPLRTGALCVFAAVTLALAAGMFGLDTGRNPVGAGGGI
ncbi:MAG TPA: DNA translocase FtsK, partial [Solirubrobacteraceae bacterium]|nr:DNA translocase FtsK [Solirubrobacteraceae bacterium]